jgi:hypothetical protein
VPIPPYFEPSIRKAVAHDGLPMLFAVGIKTLTKTHAG